MIQCDRKRFQPMWPNLPWDTDNTFRVFNFAIGTVHLYKFVIVIKGLTSDSVDGVYQTLACLHYTLYCRLNKWTVYKFYVWFYGDAV